MELTAAELRVLERTDQFAKAGDADGLASVRDDVFDAIGSAFVQGRMSGTEFEREFMNRWRTMRDHGVPTSDAVDQLFTDVDVFCGDPELFEEGDLDEAGLRSAVVEFLK
ncbi:hypothetical protein GCM10009830_02040 [Glycomyces endophyticus]|uniref:Colicin D immunity protein domain-containing protein n=1 Tax=Glycomyces endophyticus TaxID=480996 RepID=A0ABN2FVL6_9ACTN